MTDKNYINVPISSIEVPKDRARSLDKHWAEALAAMFKDHGNKVAIEVRRANLAHDGDYILVAGLHRLEAAKICGWDTMTVKVIEATSEKEVAEFRLHEVMENIGRRELTILDRAHHLFEFDRVMKELHPELKKGGNKQTEMSEEDRTAILAIRGDVAESVGLSDRSIRRAVSLWKALSKATRERVDGTWLADHQAGLQALADVGGKQQANILDVLFDPDKPPKNIQEAIEYLKSGKLDTQVEKRIGAILLTFSKLDDDLLDRVLSSQYERVEAWFKRQSESNQETT